MLKNSRTDVRSCTIFLRSNAVPLLKIKLSEFALKKLPDRIMNIIINRAGRLPENSLNSFVDLHSPKKQQKRQTKKSSLFIEG